MRIIAGEKRGLSLKTLDGQHTRPTMERVKEAMFSMVQFVLPGANVLDLYAGSGQLGFEALSRGAARCTFVDDDKEAEAVIRENCRRLNMEEQCRVRRQAVDHFLQGNQEKFDILLVDPPYRSGVFPALVERLAEVCAPEAIVLCESEPKAVFPEQAGGLWLKKQYRYGTVSVSRYQFQAE